MQQNPATAHLPAPAHTSVTHKKPHSATRINVLGAMNTNAKRKRETPGAFSGGMLQRGLLGWFGCSAQGKATGLLASA